MKMGMPMATANKKKANGDLPFNVLFKIWLGKHYPNVRLSFLQQQSSSNERIFWHSSSLSEG
jgi:hypothetical protein